MKAGNYCYGLVWKGHKSLFVLKFFENNCAVKYLEVIFYS